MKRLTIVPSIIVVGLLAATAMVILPLVVSASGPNYSEYNTPGGTNSTPVALLNGPDGNVWFLDDGATFSQPFGPYAIGRFSPTSHNFQEWSLPAGSRPQYNMIIGPDGNIWFSEGGSYQIAKVTTSGTITQYTMSGPIFDTGSNAMPATMTVGPDGNIWIALYDSGYIVVMNTSGQILRTYLAGPNDEAPSSIVRGPDNNIWYTDNDNTVGMMNACTGATTLYSIPSANGFGYNSPDGITVGPDGNIWFGIYSTHQIGKVDIKTHQVTMYTDGSNYPMLLTNGADGNLWVSEQQEQQFAVVNPSNGSIAHYSTPSLGSPVTPITGPDNNIWYAGRTFGKSIGTSYQTTIETVPSLVGDANIGESGSHPGQTPSFNANFCGGSGSGASSGGSSSSSGSSAVSSGGSTSTGSGKSSSNHEGTTGGVGATTSSSGSSTAAGAGTAPSSICAGLSPIPLSTCLTASVGPDTSSLTAAGLKVISTTTLSNHIVVQQISNGTTIASVSPDLSLGTTSYTVPSKQVLYIDGSIGPVTAQSGAIIKGTGSVGDLTVKQNAILSPGHSPGCLKVSGLQLNGTYAVQIAGSRACSGSDQVIASLPITLTGKLTIALDGFTPAVGQTFTIIKNLSRSPVIGQFAGLRQGTVLSSQGVDYTVDYTGNGEHDVVLKVTGLDTDFSSLSQAAVTQSFVNVSIFVKFVLPVLVIYLVVISVILIGAFVRQRMTNNE